MNKNSFNPDRPSAAEASTEYDAAYFAGMMAGRPFLAEEAARTPLLLRPDGWTVEDLESHLPNPTRRRTDVKMSSLDSFCRYVNEFGDKKISRIFADRGRHQFRAVLDYHDPKGAPSWCEDGATLVLTFSPEWQTWKSKDRQPFSQVAFAEFLEDNYIHIAEPDGAEILTMAANLEAKKTVHFKSGIRLSDGTQQLTYEENIESKGKGNLVLPERFTLGIPLFEHGDPVAVPARLRYRIKDEVLSFVYILHNPHQIVDAAYTAMLRAIAEATEIEPYVCA